MTKGKLYRKLFTLAVMLCCLWFVASTDNTQVSAALCCSYCDQQDFEICIWKPDAAICEACRRCSPLC